MKVCTGSGSGDESDIVVIYRLYIDIADIWAISKELRMRKWSRSYVDVKLSTIMSWRQARQRRDLILNFLFLWADIVYVIVFLSMFVVFKSLQRVISSSALSFRIEIYEQN